MEANMSMTCFHLSPVSNARWECGHGIEPKPFASDPFIILILLHEERNILQAYGEETSLSPQNNEKYFLSSKAPLEVILTPMERLQPTSNPHLYLRT